MPWIARFVKSYVGAGGLWIKPRNSMTQAGRWARLAAAKVVLKLY